MENEISQVKAFVNFTSNVTREMEEDKTRFNFDLFVFSDTEDYLCYVEAVHLLMHENERKECGFINNPQIYRKGVTADDVFNYDEFLTKDERTKEKFYVVDNTYWPEHLADEPWTAEEHKAKTTPNHQKDIYVIVQFETIYTSNDKYFAWTFIFIIILSILGFLLVFSLTCYVRQSMVFRSKSKERKLLKQELMKIRDSEYTNFLLDQSENLKKLKP